MALEVTAETSSLARVKALARVRPFLSTERHEEKYISIDSKRDIVQLNNRYNNEVKNYQFDAAYDSTTSQQTFFENEIEPLLGDLFRGLNISIFAYGMTGAGKTFTMQGTQEDPGVIPRVADALLAEMHRLEKQDIGNLPANVIPSDEPLHSLCVSYLEIYNDKAYDLLEPSDSDLQIREDAAKNILIPNLARSPIHTLAQFLQLYHRGCRHRSTGATALNAHSSRSHAVVVLTLRRRLWLPAAGRSPPN